MKSFNYFAPTEIIYGEDSLKKLGEVCARYGKKALLVSTPIPASMQHVYDSAVQILREASVEVFLFNQAKPNPTTDNVSCGAALAKEKKVEVVIGMGGGSSMDTAKAIAVEAVHPGTAWEYLHYTSGPTEKTLPIIAVGTTAGTGSQTTPCAVITNTALKDKSAIWHKNIFPRVAIVDPVLTMTMPSAVTAQTGFDAFCHNFEAYLSVGSHPMTETLALDAIARIAKWLPVAFADGSNMEARSEMAWADTLGGLTNASSGVTLPHGLGMQVGGHCPHVTHGQALAAIYPEFTRFTMDSAEKKFAAVGRILNPEMISKDDHEAALGCCDAIDALLKKIGLWFGFKDLGVTKEDLRQIADCGQVLGDYKNNPRIASIEEMYELLMRCYER